MFYLVATGKTVRLRGSNFIRLGKQPHPGGSTVTYHSTFDPTEWDAVGAEKALEKMHQDGYNFVRVFLNGLRVGNSTTGVGVDPNYIANVKAFLALARKHNVYVYLTFPFWLNANYPYKNTNPQVSGYHGFYLTKAGVAARQQMIEHILKALLAGGAPLQQVVAYDLMNEGHFREDQLPLSLSKGSVTTFLGTYDMGSTAQRNKMMNDAFINLINTLRAAIRELHPTALVSLSFYAPRAVQGPDQRVLPPPVPVVLSSTADFVDLHLYNWGSMSELAKDVGLPASTSKPVVMGETGVTKKDYPQVTKAAYWARDWQVASCKRGFDGWLFWTFDGCLGSNAVHWDLLDKGGAINGQWAPVARPDPCVP